MTWLFRPLKLGTHLLCAAVAAEIVCVFASVKPFFEHKILLVFLSAISCCYIIIIIIVVCEFIRIINHDM